MHPTPDYEKVDLLCDLPNWQAVLYDSMTSSSIWQYDKQFYMTISQAVLYDLYDKQFYMTIVW